MAPFADKSRNTACGSGRGVILIKGIETGLGVPILVVANYSFLPG